MKYLFLIISNFFFIFNAYAYRDVPSHYISGLDGRLPANYYKFIKFENKDSPEYLVVAHELTLDLLLIADQEAKVGNLITSFHTLRLANYLFPHRGDVSKKYYNSGEALLIFLNSERTACNDAYEYVLTIIKTNFPVLLKQVNESKCEAINKKVRDINDSILLLEKEALTEGARKVLDNHKKLLTFTDEKSYSPKQRKEILSLLLQSYLGYLEFRGTHSFIDNDYKFNVGLEMIRKNSFISYEGLRMIYGEITGEDINKIQFPQLNYTLRLIKNDKIITYPLKMNIESYSCVNIWLNIFNFFYYDGYESKRPRIYHYSVPKCIRFTSDKLKFDFSYDANLRFFRISGLPDELIPEIKKLDIIPAL